MFPMRNADQAIRNLIQDDRLFDYYRLVDAQTYETFDYRDGGWLPSHQKCYAIWERGQACRNCTSRMAAREKRLMVKMEYVNSTVFFIMSQPVYLDGRSMTLELIKDITGSLVVNDAFHQENIPVENIITQLNEIATRDPYTGLYNKRFGEQEIERLVGEFADTGRRFCTAIFDIDQFKAVNDTYGHLEGDRVIDYLVGLFQKSVRDHQACACRFGGDEFLLIFEDAAESDIRDRLGKVCRIFEEHVFYKDSQPYQVGLSAGILEYATCYGDWRAYLDQVDRAMYRVKQEKRR